MTLSDLILYNDMDCLTLQNVCVSVSFNQNKVTINKCCELFHEEKLNKLQQMFYMNFFLSLCKNALSDLLLIEI